MTICVKNVKKIKQIFVHNALTDKLFRIKHNIIVVVILIIFFRELNVRNVIQVANNVMGLIQIIA